MARVLTGIQSSGSPHLGNVLGAILPALQAAATNAEPAFFFIADLHTLTSSRDAARNHASMLQIAAAWLACGLDVNKDVFYRQSDVPEVTELTWYLSCFTPYPMLANAHSFKEKSANLPEVRAGLFIYPVLMAADILLYQATHVPVGKDQRQHLEIARDIAAAVNHQLGKEVFTLPEAVIAEEVMTIPGTDGRKMSKSYGNTLNIFEEEKALRKAVMSIATDSTPLEAPKNPEVDTVFKLYSLLAPLEKTEALRQRYITGGYGYGQAKQELFTEILERFTDARQRYAAYMAAPQELEQVLAKGAVKARKVAQPTLQAVRKALGFE